MNLAAVAGAVAGGALVLAGASKLASRQWPAQAEGLGAPRWVAPVLPWVELVLGALLATGVARPWPALAAAALLAVFTVFLALRLRQGRRAPCACFGPLSGRAISWWSVARNVVLVALALWAATA